METGTQASQRLAGGPGNCLESVNSSDLSSLEIRDPCQEIPRRVRIVSTALVVSRSEIMSQDNTEGSGLK